MRRTLALPALLAVTCLAAVGQSFAQDASPALPPQPPAPFKPEAGDAGAPGRDTSRADAPSPDTWIFSGNLQGSHESYSGTLVASKSEGEFEMKLGSGATCDGQQLTGDIGLVRLPEITCSDDRTLRALFVPQGGTTLKVYGHVGEERFTAEAHLLGTEAPPAPRPSAAPHGPLGLPPRPPGAPPSK